MEHYGSLVTLGITKPQHDISSLLGITVCYSGEPCPSDLPIHAFYSKGNLRNWAAECHDKGPSVSRHCLFNKAQLATAWNPTRPLSNNQQLCERLKSDNLMVSSRSRAVLLQGVEGIKTDSTNPGLVLAAV